VTPIFLRITSGRNKLVPGPFSLGRWYLPIGIVAVSWVCFITILLLFPPESNPTAGSMSESGIKDHSLYHADTFLLDYAVVIVMSVFIFASISWIVSARKWFTGPISTVEKGYQEKESHSS
jgi:hypothetical protein